MNKVKTFVNHLLQNPSLNALDPLQKEGHVLQFLRNSAEVLTPTLTSPNYFPGMGWDRIYELLREEVVRATDIEFLKAIKRLMTSAIQFSFVSEMGMGHVSLERIQQQVYDVVMKIVSNPVSRAALGPSFTAIYYNTINRYINEVCARNSYIHFELTKVERLRMSPDQIISMIYVGLLLRPAVYMFSGDAFFGRVSGTLQKQFVERTIVKIKAMLPLLPEKIVKSAFNSNVSFLESRDIEATARITAIFAVRGKNYYPNVQVDRGADTPDKSWLSVVRRNYKYYGFDNKMIDEFYSIAAENGW